MSQPQEPHYPSSSGPLPSQSKERGAIAAQACDTCRSRKQRCNEQRPKCSLCQKLKFECRYREPQPTKKDQTLVKILERLIALEGKVDRITPAEQSTIAASSLPQMSPASQPSSSNFIEDHEPFTPAASLRPSTQPSPGNTASPIIPRSYRHASAAHRMLTWPAIQQLLVQSLVPSVADIKILEQDGSAFMIQVHREMPDLPLSEDLEKRPFMGMQSQSSRTAGASRVTFPLLSRGEMYRLATSYFDTFNFIYPFMDRQNFLSEALGKVLAEGFDSDADSVLALLIFALGELAIEGARGDPIDTYNGRHSGVRGGTAERPPGLAYFNEARKHMGFVSTQCELETVQIFSLAALYYESCSRHMDFWRTTVAAASACKVLVTCNPVDWGSQKGDLVKRVFWHCAIMEMALYLELDLPPTGIIELEEQINLPRFNGPHSEADHRGNQSSHFEAHFASQVALRRLCALIHQTLDNSNLPLASSTDANDARTTNAYGGPTPESLTQLASQLSQWRNILPPKLQWAEDDPESFPTPQAETIETFHHPNLTSGSPNMPLFCADLRAEYVQYPYAYDIQVALLRTRYYYAKYMVYRPFVYKALHFPGQISEVDAEGVAECLRCCLKWPLALSPASRHKRMIPYLFCWSQNFLSILIVVHMTQHNDMLRDIRAQLCGPRFEAEIGDTVETMIDWIRDLKNSDPISLWCWKILQPVYCLEP